MALVKTKPTSPGRRSMLKVVNGTAQGCAVAALARAAVQARPAVTIMATSPRVTKVVVTSSITASSISSATTRTASPPRSSAWNTTRTAAPHRPAVLRRRRASLHHRAQGRDRWRSNWCPARKHRSRLATRCRCAISRSVPPCIASKCCLARARRLARSAGTSVQLLAREGVYAQLRLRSGEIRKVHVDCRATIGEVGNGEHSLRVIGKAGANRWRGWRPTVRAINMNPVDHPMGGRGNGGGRLASPGFAVGPEGQGSEDPHQQAHQGHDCAQPPQSEVSEATDMTRSVKKGPFC